MLACRLQRFGFTTSTLSDSCPQNSGNACCFPCDYRASAASKVCPGPLLQTPRCWEKASFTPDARPHPGYMLYSSTLLPNPHRQKTNMPKKREREIYIYIYKYIRQKIGSHIHPPTPRVQPLGILLGLKPAQTV